MSVLSVTDLKNGFLNGKSLGEHARSELLGGRPLNEILDELERKITQDIDSILKQRIAQVETSARAFASSTLVEARKELGLAVDREVARAVVLARDEAKAIVDHSMNRATSVAERLIGELTRALNDQRRDVKLDISDVAAAFRKELNRLGVWVFLATATVGVAIVVAAAIVSK